MNEFMAKRQHDWNSFLQIIQIIIIFYTWIQDLFVSKDATQGSQIVYVRCRFISIML